LVVGLIPVFGLVQDRAYGSRGLWYGYVVLVFITLAFGAVGLVGEMASNFSLLEAVAAVPGFVLSGIYLYALHQYLVKRAYLWQKS
jgi:hypothetical protein